MDGVGDVERVGSIDVLQVGEQPVAHERVVAQGGENEALSLLRRRVFEWVVFGEAREELVVAAVKTLEGGESLVVEAVVDEYVNSGVKVIDFG